LHTTGIAAAAAASVRHYVIGHNIALARPDRLADVDTAAAAFHDIAAIARLFRH